MEKEPISKKDQATDALLISVSGGVIGIIGAIAEINIFSASILDVNAVIGFGGATLVGLGLMVKGAMRFVELTKSLRDARNNSAPK